MTSQNITAGWLVLRCQGRRTLGLADSLKSEGFEVWTPRVPPTPPPWSSERRPRSRSRRGLLHCEELVPAMPTFVFASEHHLDDLAILSETRPFSLMLDRVWHRGFIVIADRALDHLRWHEERKLAEAEKRKPKPPAQPFGAGEAIRPPSGPYEGLPGIVASSDGRHTWLDFGGIMGRVKVETFRLRGDREAA